MSLSEFVETRLEAPVAAIRRHVVSWAVAAAAAIGALFYGASAAMIALEVELGAVKARLLVAVALLLIAIVGYFLPRWSSHANGTAAAEPQPEGKRMTRNQKIAMVFEALLLGFSMGSQKNPQDNHGRK